MNDANATDTSAVTAQNSIFFMASLLITLSFMVLAVGPLWDIDLWWHLASGREIVEKMHLPSGDPFNFTSASEISQTNAFLLKGYWLSQAILYVAYDYFGEHGVLGVRVLTLASIPLLVMFSCRRWGVPASVTILMAILCGWLTLYYTGERPQLFSFLFVTLLFILLEETGYARKAPDGEVFHHSPGQGWFIPLLMLLWANMHPGFLLGVALIGLYIATEAVKIVVLKHPVHTGKFLAVAGTVLCGILATLLSPNGLAPYTSILSFHSATMGGVNSEYLSPWVLYRSSGLIVYPYWLYLVLISTVLLASLRNADMTRLMIVGSLVVLSLQAYRFIPFLVFGTVLYCARSIPPMIPTGKLPARLVGTIAGASVCILLAQAFVLKGPPALKTLRSPLVSVKSYPVGAVQFIQKERPSGEMFNLFNWGGYLEWRLFPAYKTFIDGRNLRQSVFDDYRNILWTESRWELLLDKHTVNMVVLSAVDNFTGELYELANFLYRSADWKLVYADDTALILVRGEENRAMASRYPLAKEQIYTHVLKRIAQLRENGLQNRHTWRAIGTAYNILGQHEKAEYARSMALKSR